MRCLWSGGPRSHSRMMSGPWLAANAPTRLAMIQAPDEFVVLHADGEEVVAQEIRIGARREERHVVFSDGALHALIERIAREDFFARRAELGRRRGRLQVEEKLAQPIVAHEIGDRYVIILSACARSICRDNYVPVPDFKPSGTPARPCQYARCRGSTRPTGRCVPAAISSPRARRPCSRRRPLRPRRCTR